MTINDPACAFAVDEELMGWAYVTNQLLLDNARNTIAMVEEPSERAAIEAEYVAGIARLMNTHAAAVTSSLRAAVTTTAGGCSGRRETSESLHSSTNTLVRRCGDIDFGRGAHGSPNDRLRGLLHECVEYTETMQQAKQELLGEVAALRRQLDARKISESPNGTAALDQRVVPSLLVSPPPFGLLSLRKQREELSLVAASTPNDIVDTPRMQGQNLDNCFVEDALDTLSPTPRCRDLQNWGMERVSAAERAWKERMELLRSELQSFRREIGG